MSYFHHTASWHCQILKGVPYRLDKTWLYRISIQEFSLHICINVFPAPSCLLLAPVTHTCVSMALLVSSQGGLTIHRTMWDNGHVAKHTSLVFRR